MPSHSILHGQDDHEPATQMLIFSSVTCFLRAFENTRSIYEDESWDDHEMMLRIVQFFNSHAVDRRSRCTQTGKHFLASNHQKTPFTRLDQSAYQHQRHPHFVHGWIGIKEWASLGTFLPDSFSRSSLCFLAGLSKFVIIIFQLSNASINSLTGMVQNVHC